MRLTRESALSHCFQLSQLALLLLTLGCAEKLSADDDGSGPSSSSNGPNIETLEERDGIMTTLVDAKSTEEWVYLNLDTGMEVQPENPEEDLTWDLAFQRFKIKSNGGISGTGEVEIARLSGMDFAELMAAPADGYQVDAEDSEDLDSEPDYVFLGETPWFDYDITEHTLSPADFVYVIMSVEGTYFKFQMLDYYDEAGTSGYPLFQWGMVSAPE